MTNSPFMFVAQIFKMGHFGWLYSRFSWLNHHLCWWAPVFSCIFMVTSCHFHVHPHLKSNISQEKMEFHQPQGRISIFKQTWMAIFNLNNQQKRNLFIYIYVCVNHVSPIFHHVTSLLPGAFVVRSTTWRASPWWRSSRATAMAARSWRRCLRRSSS